MIREEDQMRAIASSVLSGSMHPILGIRRIVSLASSMSLRSPAIDSLRGIESETEEFSVDESERTGLSDGFLRLQDKNLEEYLVRIRPVLWEALQSL